jgi:hypothetical protein
LPYQLRAAAPCFLFAAVARNIPDLGLLLLYQKKQNFFRRGYIDLRMHEEGIRVD